MQVEGSGAEPRGGSSFDTNLATMPRFGGGSIGDSITDPERENPSHIEISDGGDDAAANERAAKGGEFVAVSEAAGASEEHLLLRRVVEAIIKMQETLTRLLVKSPSVASRASSTAASLNANCEKVHSRITLRSRIVELEKDNAELVKRNAELEVRNADLEKQVKAWADKDAARIEKKRAVNNRWYNNSKERKAKSNG